MVLFLAKAGEVEMVNVYRVIAQRKKEPGFLGEKYFHWVLVNSDGVIILEDDLANRIPYTNDGALTMGKQTGCQFLEKAIRHIEKELGEQYIAHSETHSRWVNEHFYITSRKG
jgi:hypothetical protein